MNLYATSVDFIESHRLLQKGSRILVAVSGGADSMTLLHLFHRLQTEWNLVLAVAHVNHKLRGRHADADEQFVANAARSMGYAFYSSRTDAAAYARTKKLSPEAGAREVRMDFLQTTAERLFMDAVALGHHADDQAETVIMHLSRGGGVRGLRGICPHQGIFIHPLLFCRKIRIEEYVQRHNLPFVIDSSNRDLRFLRNRIRHNVLPVLEKEIGGHVTEAINRSADHLRETHEYLASRTRLVHGRLVTCNDSGQIDLDLIGFRRYFTIIRKMLISLVIEKDLGGRRPGFHEIEAVLTLADRGRIGAEIPIDDLRVRRCDSTLRFYRVLKAGFSIPVHETGEVPMPDGRHVMKLRRIRRTPNLLLNEEDPRIELFDYERMRWPLQIRNRKKGDWFIPLGMAGRKKLQDFFTDEKIVLPERDETPLLVSGEDIVWVVGYRIDERYKVNNETQWVLEAALEKRERYSKED